jgi:hypothetical protein
MAWKASIFCVSTVCMASPWSMPCLMRLSALALLVTCRGREGRGDRTEDRDGGVRKCACAHPQGRPEWPSFSVRQRRQSSLPVRRLARARRACLFGRALTWSSASLEIITRRISASFSFETTCGGDGSGAAAGASDEEPLLIVGPPSALAGTCEGERAEADAAPPRPPPLPPETPACDGESCLPAPAMRPRASPSRTDGFFSPCRRWTFSRVLLLDMFPGRAVSLSSVPRRLKETTRPFEASTSSLQSPGKWWAMVWKHTEQRVGL